MSYGATVILVLIASPSDVEEERGVIVEALNQWNSMYSFEKNMVLLPVMWETHSSPELGDHPQHVINRQIVDHCDMAIACFWTRLGTNTPSAKSGTIEEIENMLNEDKLVMLYFSEANPPYEHDSDQLSQVKEFRKSYRDKGLVDKFTTPQELKNKVLRQISLHVERLRNESEPAITKTHTVKDSQPITNITLHSKRLTQEEKDNVTLNNVLTYLFREAGEGGLHISYCSDALKMGYNEALHYIEILIDKGLVETNFNNEDVYLLSKEGRASVIERGLN